MVLLKYLIVLCQECRGRNTEEMNPGTHFEAREYFDKIPAIIFQQYTSLKSNEWAICIANYEQDDVVKG